MDSLLGHFEVLLATTTPVQFCRLLWAFVITSVALVGAAPLHMRRLLTQYGARGNGSSTPAPANPGQADRRNGSVLGTQSKRRAMEATPSIAGNKTREGSHSAAEKDVGQDQPNMPLTGLVEWMTSISQVPHSWFYHFYILSVTSSLFWAGQYTCDGPVWRAIARWQVSSHDTGETLEGMTLNQVVLVWALMALQGCRRLLECLFVIRPSSSKMWIVHWLVGCGFYILMGMSIWVEGLDALLRTGPRVPISIKFSAMESVGTAVFAIVWILQYKCHSHLANLRKYSLPEWGLFRHVICPHYMCECFIYLALAIVAAPQGQWYNRTISCGLLFVSANLGFTAHGTRQWYEGKFGREKIKKRWNMIPLVY